MLGVAPTAHRHPGPRPYSGRRSVLSPDRAGASDLVRKAGVMRFRDAAKQQFGEGEGPSVKGFNVTRVPQKRGFFNRRVPPWILGRFVSQVDAAAIQESWAMASRLKKDD